MSKPIASQHISLRAVSIVVLLAGPLCVAGVNRAIDAFGPAPAPISAPEERDEAKACHPEIESSLLDRLDRLVPLRTGDAEISKRIEALFRADQAERGPLAVFGVEDPTENDLNRRVEVLEFLRANKIRSPKELVAAAFIFQHGDCPEHYLLANKLAAAALRTGSLEAKWIYAATLDRYRMSLGEPQKFGTQYAFVDGRFDLYPVDPATTDEERRIYNVPPLDAARERAKDLQSGAAGYRMAILSSWWLTLLGVAFAAMGAVLAFCGPSRATRLAAVNMLAAIGVYLASAAGHYLQVVALAKGPEHMAYQQTLWRNVALAGAVLLVLESVYLLARMLRRRESVQS